MTVDFVAFAYAAAVAAGGILGYVRKGSVMSGLMGVTAGGLMAVGAYQTTVDPNNYHLSLGVSGGLLGLMGYRWVMGTKLCFVLTRQITVLVIT